MSGDSGVHFEVELEHDGIWPTRWTWTVRREERDELGAIPGTFSVRFGDALTKDRARRKALRARRSMEADDVRVEW